MNTRTTPFETDGLTGLRIEPDGGTVGKLIVLLHGYGGDAASNAAFGEKLAAARADAAVAVLDGTAPVPPENDPSRRQWWNLDETRFDGRLCSFMPYLARPEQRELIARTVPEIHETAVRLNRFVLKTVKAYGLNARDCFLAGISQGGITAFETALFCDGLENLGGLISIGSGIVGADRLHGRPANAVPVLLARGARDEIFPKTVDYFSRAVLRESGHPVELAEADSAHFGLEHAVCGAVCDFIGRHC